MRKMLAVVMVFVMAILITSCGKETKKAEVQSAEVKVEAASAGSQIAVIETEKGTIKFKFFSDDAPGTVANFIKLTESGFYNGLIFHRYEPGFVIQGGDPKGNGTGGPGYNIKAEFNKNPHIAGTVAMARSANPDSAGSQFYICLAPAPFLDNNYTVFGQVTEGMETVLKLRAGDKMTKVSIEK